MTPFLRKSPPLAPLLSTCGLLHACFKNLKLNFGKLSQSDAVQSSHSQNLRPRFRAKHYRLLFECERRRLRGPGRRHVDGRSRVPHPLRMDPRPSTSTLRRAPPSSFAATSPKPAVCAMFAGLAVRCRMASSDSRSKNTESSSSRRSITFVHDEYAAAFPLSRNARRRGLANFRSRRLRRS